MSGVGKGLQIAAATLTVFIGLGWLLSSWSGGEGSFRYYTSVAEYRADADGGRASRVHGFVQQGSIQKDLRAGYVDFVIRDAQGATLPVRLLSVELPDMFRDDAEVVVEGQLAGDRFVAEKVLAKCPSKYEAAKPPEA
jgi:cytochrome c-type biogenesis protein CcmE